MPSSPKNFMPVVEEVKWERTTTESRISTVIGMLPASLQSRMGPLRTFRRTTSLGNIDLVEGVTTSTKALSRPRPLSAAETQTMSVRDAEEVEEVESVSSAATKNSDSPSPGSRDRDTGGTPVSSSRINWKLGLQGELHSTSSMPALCGRLIRSCRKWARGHSIGCQPRRPKQGPRAQSVP